MFSVQKLHKTIKEDYGEGVAFWFLALTASQYHFMFYSSRPLPNIMALPLVLLAVNSWLKHDNASLIWFSAAAVIIFRFELAIFLGLIIIIELLIGYTSLVRWTNRYKSISYWFGSLYVVLHVVANIILSSILLRVAYDNYPGGYAIARLHKLVPPEVTAHVYIDNLSAQTGVSRFTQVNSNWIYNKTENLASGNKDYFLFSHLLIEARSKYSPNLKLFSSSHDIIDIVDGFSHINLNYNSFPPFKIKSKPMIFILKKNTISKYYEKSKTPLPSVEAPLSQIKKVIADLKVSETVVYSKTDETRRPKYSDNLKGKDEVKQDKDEAPEIIKAPPKKNIHDLFEDMYEQINETINIQVLDKDKRNVSFKEKRTEEL